MVDHRGDVDRLHRTAPSGTPSSGTPSNPTPGRVTAEEQVTWLGVFPYSSGSIVAEAARPARAVSWTLSATGGASRAAGLGHLFGVFGCGVASPSRVTTRFLTARVSI